MNFEYYINRNKILLFVPISSNAFKAKDIYFNETKYKSTNSGKQIELQH